MGADYVGAFVPVTRSRAEALNALHDLSDEAIMQALKYTNLDWEFDEGDLYIFPEPDAPEPTGINRTNMMPVLEALVTETYDILEDRYRDAGWFRHDDILFVTAAGMSWGDTPEHIDALGIVYFLGVTYDQSKKLAWVDKS